MSPRPKKKLPKIFVLDTNVILHDHRAIQQFKDYLDKIRDMY